METVDKAILERIKKLQAKADSLKEMGPAYEQEALTFATAVQQMLLKHDLEMSDVEYMLDVEKDPVKLHQFTPSDFGLPDKKREILWEQALAVTVAHAHHADIIPIEKSNAFYFIGRGSHRAIAEYMFVYLSRLVLQMADTSYVKRFYELRAKGNVEAARGYRASFIEAMVARIIIRYRENTSKLVDELSQRDRKVAMVRLSNEQALIKAAVDELKAAGFMTDDASKPLGNKKENVLGLIDGDEAGKKVNLNQTGMKGSPAHQQVTTGQKLLGGGEGGATTNTD